MKMRSPIITICGHVDHGKTSLLDSLRGTCIAEQEAGHITQKISFSSITKEIIEQRIGNLLEKRDIKLNIPGFLFIDTPGHAAFTNLRKRGGSLADLAVLVIDINEGIKPQTSEVIQILKYNKTPFLIALNKIDNISGWRTDKNKSLKESIESQATNVKQAFDEKYMTLIASLNSYGFDADIFYNIQDFTKKIALVPTSARTKQGIPELIMVLCGLSQKYLSDKLKLGKDARGVILEVKKDKSMNYAEAILYDGYLKKTDEIAIADFNGGIITTKIRVLEEILPLCNKFRVKNIVTASTGLRMQLVEKSDILPGMPFLIYKDNKSEIESEFRKELTEAVKTDKHGIIAKADSLGSLEALLVMLKQEKIPVVDARIGTINKTDIIRAKANLEINEIDSVVIGFNTQIDEDAKQLSGDKKIKIITNEVIYKLIDDLIEFRLQKSMEIEKRRLMELATIGKAEILHQYVFRNSNPAIFGVRIDAGKFKQHAHLIDEDGNKIGKIKNIQSDKKSIDEATEGMEVAISVSGANFERTLRNRKILYTDISESQFKIFGKNKDLLSEKEIKALQEIAEMKRKEKADWGT